MTSEAPQEIPQPRIPNQPDPEFTLPQQTSNRVYEESEFPTVELTPGTPREKGLVEAFKKTIAQHLNDVEDKTTQEFLDGLALNLWRITRVPYK